MYSTINKVLVLNSDYQPINICSVRRAFNLILNGRADIIKDYKNSPLKSGNYEFPRPSIIRIKKYVIVPYRKIQVSRHNIFKRDGFQCNYCNNKTELTIDHVLPKSRGGLSTWDNMTTCCMKCNRFKDNRTPEEAHMTMRITPYKPNLLIFLRNFNGNLNEDWKPYLFV